MRHATLAGGVKDCPQPLQTSAATGLVSCLVGLYAQMISATREQRVLIVTGIIAGFVGLALGLSRGGFLA